MTTQLSILTAVVLALLAAFVARRAIGVSVGWPRTIAASLIAAAGLGPLLGYVGQLTGVDTAQRVEAHPWAAVAITALVAAWLLVGAIALVALTEMLVPTGTVPGPLQLVRSMRASRRRTRRYRQVTTIAIRNGLGGLMRGRVWPGNTAGVAISLRETLTQCGVTFIKLGQTFAARADLLPEPFVVELSKLHAGVETEPWSVIEAALAKGLARPVEEVFASIDPEPLAAASIAQVHRGRLRDGARVVVKVQRPAARAQADADLDVIVHLARTLERRTTWAADIGLFSLAQSFAASVREELDYRTELSNMTAIAGAATRRGAVLVPHGYEEFSSTTVLVMSELEGVPVSAAGERLAQIDPGTRAQLATDLFGEIVREIAVTGVFHSDLHPGNVFVCPPASPDGPPRFGLLDFGSVGRLDSTSRAALGRLLLAIDSGRADSALDALLSLVDAPRSLNERELERAIGGLLARYSGPGKGFATEELFDQLMAVVSGFSLTIPSSMAFAFRALGLLEGTARIIDPDFDTVTALRREGKHVMARQFEPGNLKNEAIAQLSAVLPVLQRLPRRLDRLGEAAENGSLTVRMRMLAHPSDRAFVTGLVQQAIVALLACASLAAGVAFMLSRGGPLIAPEFTLYTFVGEWFMLAGVALGLRSLIGIFASRRSRAARSWHGEDGE